MLPRAVALLTGSRCYCIRFAGHFLKKKPPPGAEVVCGTQSDLGHAFYFGDSAGEAGASGLADGEGEAVGEASGAGLAGLAGVAGLAGDSSALTSAGTTKARARTRMKYRIDVSSLHGSASIRSAILPV